MEHACSSTNCTKVSTRFLNKRMKQRQSVRESSVDLLSSPASHYQVPLLLVNNYLPVRSYSVATSSTVVGNHLAGWYL